MWSRWSLTASGSSVTTTSGRRSSISDAIGATTSSRSTAASAFGGMSPFMPESAKSSSTTSSAPSTLAAARSSPSRTTASSAGLLVVPLVSSPASPRVAQHTMTRTPRAAALAITEPVPNVSSSGCATTTSRRVPSRGMAADRTRRRAKGDVTLTVSPDGRVRCPLAGECARSARCGTESLRWALRGSTLGSGRRSPSPVTPVAPAPY